MKTVKFYLCFLIIAFVSPTWTCVLAEKTSDILFYVSSEGNDAQTGTSVDKPFATLQKARDAIRELKKEGELR